MITEEISDRLATVIFAATRCRGFALVVFYDDKGGEEWANTYSALINRADPQTAAVRLNEIAEEYYRQAASDLRLS